MTMDDPVRRALADLAEAEASRHAPPHLEHAVLETFDRLGKEAFLQRWAAAIWAHGHEVLAVAVGVAVVVTTTIYFRMPDHVISRVPERPVEPLISRPEVPPIDPVSAWMTGDDIMHSLHLRVPRSVLPQLGVPILEPDADGMINLEVLVAQDGVARTIRVVPDIERSR